MKLRKEFIVMMEYIQRGLLGDVKTCIMQIRLLPHRVDWTKIHYKNTLNTPLHLVANTKNDYMLNYLMEEGLLACLEQPNFNGDRPLHLAAKIGNIFAVNKFIETGVQIDPWNMHNYTPLMHSVSTRDQDSTAVVQALLAQGSNSTLLNRFGQTATSICCGLGTLEALQMLLVHAPSTAFVSRIDGRTPLHAAAHHGRKELLELLLKQGKLLDSNVRDSCGNTPIMDALRRGHATTVEAFKQLWPDTDIHAKDNTGRGCFHAAAEGGYVDSIRFLVDKHKLNPLDSDNNGLCGLHVAAAEGCSEAVRELVNELHVPVDVPDSNGKTPLWWAVERRRTACAEELLELGATPLPQHSAQATHAT